MPTQPELEQLARTVAQAHGLDQSLFLALIENESSWNPWAFRFEPAFLKTYLHDSPFSASETQARATSFGLAQVLGQVAREYSFTGKFLTELCDPETGLKYGAMKLRDCMKRANGDERDALLRYNGGGDKQYPDRVFARRQKYAAEVTA
jgi:soluble lytic murein transglycosylase-like protein